MDEYTAEAMLFHQKFCVGPHKLTGWKRLVGQEVPVEAYSDLMSIAGTSNYSAVVAGLLDINGNAATGAPVNSSVTARRLTQVLNGPQTPKAQQPALDLWVPLKLYRSVAFVPHSGTHYTTLQCYARAKP